eukprot:CAMPEP_0171695972 /NCGR_PEP_ID=MMETSP0991-20121206/8049_1 /TAXON_ID=483369 /ORGANISM="non described non described, Strain CCMP2098" /LENGTH=56 /DNA_ID=CAMNT_0012284687 /DNA_START=721 /DNA_END=891 /DNA_ORIENTATION=+
MQGQNGPTKQSSSVTFPGLLLAQSTGMFPTRSARRQVPHTRAVTLLHPAVKSSSSI